jgi:hypothetical protein
VADLLRTYRRVFNVDRRIYSIEGRQIPIPGGIPMRFLAWAGSSLIAIALLRSGSPAVMVLCVAIGGLIGRRRAEWTGAAIGAVLGWAVFTVASFALSLPDWPLTYVVLPFGVALFAMAAEPDGRAPHRFALSLLAWQLAPTRTDGVGGIPAVGETRMYRASECYIAPDWRSPVLRAGRLAGPAALTFERGARVRRRMSIPLLGRRGDRYVIRPPESRLRGSKVVGTLELGDGEQAEVRP